MKGLFYSQAIHRADLPTLSLSLCAKLIQDFEIDFLYGSPAPRSLISESRFHRIQMPPFPSDRTEFFKQEVKPPYDFFLTELFPFGKLYLVQEILFLIDWLKKENPACRIVCSLPDVFELVEQQHAIKLFTAKYDACFYHADQAYMRVEDIFPATANFQKQIFYTGFVPNGLEPAPPAERQKRVLVTITTHVFSKEFVRIVLPILSHFPEYEFIFILPSKVPPFLEEVLQEWMEIHRGISIQILPSQRSLERLMRSSALLIGLANSPLIELAATKTPGVILDIGPLGKQLRLHRFAHRNLVTRVRSSDFDPDHLQKIVHETLRTPYPEVQIDTEGALHTLEKLKSFII